MNDIMNNKKDHNVVNDKQLCSKYLIIFLNDPLNSMNHDSVQKWGVMWVLGLDTYPEVVKKMYFLLLLLEICQLVLP